MNSDILALHEKIQAFSLDEIDAVYPLSRRLAHENRWTVAYTQRTIEEYKKFVLLAMIAEHSVTPSEQIDQVWHLHLIYSRSYWEEFCPKVLGRSLHHGPTQGGAQEAAKHRDWYCQTLKTYEQTFGYAPPSDIWPASDRRFGLDTQVERVNIQQNWVIPKPNFPRFSWFTIDLSSRDGSNAEQHLRGWIGLGLAIALIFGTSGCTVVNPIEMAGPDFLALYFSLGMVLLTLGYVWRWRGMREPETVLVETLNPYELAYLNTGRNRVADVAVTSLVKSNVVSIEDDQSWQVVSPQPDVKLEPIEQRVLNSIQSGMSIYQLREQDCSGIEDLRSKLQQNGLIPSNAQATKIQSIAFVLMSGLLGVGLVRLGLGMSKHRPVGFLIMMIILFVLVGIGLFIIPERTRKGDQAIESASALCLPQS